MLCRIRTVLHCIDCDDDETSPSRNFDRLVESLRRFQSEHETDTHQRQLSESLLFSPYFPPSLPSFLYMSSPSNRSSQSISNAQYDVMCLLSASTILSTGSLQLFTNSSEALRNRHNSSTASSIYSISSQGFILSLRLFLLFLELPCRRQLRCSLLPLRHDRRHCYAGQTATRQLCCCGCR